MVGRPMTCRDIVVSPFALFRARVPYQASHRQWPPTHIFGSIIHPIGVPCAPVQMRVLIPPLLLQMTHSPPPGYRILPSLWTQTIIIINNNSNKRNSDRHRNNSNSNPFHHPTRFPALHTPQSQLTYSTTYASIPHPIRHRSSHQCQPILCLCRRWWVGRIILHPRWRIPWQKWVGKLMFIRWVTGFLALVIGSTTLIKGLSCPVIWVVVVFCRTAQFSF